jgi:hypothetical protein
MDKWFHGGTTFGQLFSEDVQTTNNVNPNIFFVICVVL